MVATKQLNSEKHIQKSRELFAEAQAIAKMGHWELDMETQQLLWSDQQYRIYGYEPGEFALNDEYFLFKTTHHSDLKRIKQIIDNAMRRGEGYNFDRRIVRKDGSLGYAQTIAKVIRSREGIVTRIIGITQDISERKNTELLLSTVLNSSISAIEAFGSKRDESGRIVDFQFLLVNSVSEKLRGNLNGSLTGKTIRKEDKFEFVPELFDRLVDVVEKKAPLTAEHRYNSGEFVLHVNAVPLDDGFVLTFEDITFRKKIEKEAFDLRTRQQEEIVQTIFRTQEEERKRVAEALNVSFNQLLNINNYKREGLNSLSKRELEILKYIAEGFTNSEIAEKTFTSKRTVDSHRKHILEKTGSGNTAALIKYAILSGLIQ